MTDERLDKERRDAFAWAKATPFHSVAADYARTLAYWVEELRSYDSKKHAELLAKASVEADARIAALEKENEELKKEGDWRVRADYEALRLRYDELRDKFNVLKSDIRNALNALAESKAPNATDSKD